MTSRCCYRLVSKAPPKNKDVYLSYVSPIHYNSVVVSTVDNQSHAGWARTEDPATGRTYYFHVVWPCEVLLTRRRREIEQARARQSPRVDGVESTRHRRETRCYHAQVETHETSWTWPLVISAQVETRETRASTWPPGLISAKWRATCLS